MTRRKQNAPQRLTSEDGEEVREDGEKAESVKSESTNEMAEVDGEAESKTMDTENIQSEATAKEKGEEPDKIDSIDSQAEINVDDMSGQDENPENFDEQSVKSPESKELENGLTLKDSHNDDNSSESEFYSKSIPHEMDLDLKEKDTVSKKTRNSDTKTEREIDGNNIYKDATFSDQFSAKHSTVPDKSKSTEPKTKKSKSSLFSISGGESSESPMSKLLHMVNNPETLHRKRPSNSYSLAATSSSSSKQTASLSSTYSSASITASPSPSPSSSSLAAAALSVKSSKPLSGFLPPYNVYAHFQNMYSKMSKYLDGVDTDRPVESSSILKRKRKSFHAPHRNISPKVNSSPVSSPVSTETTQNQDQPLDLSVKSTGLDLSKKPQSDDVSRKGETAIKNEEPYIHNFKDEKTAKTSSMESSLKSLEEKFGSGTFKMDPAKSKSHIQSSNSLKTNPFLPFVHPMLPVYGGTLYASALFNTHPWMQLSEKLARSYHNETSPPRKSSVSPPTSQQNNTTIPKRRSSSVLSHHNNEDDTRKMAAKNVPEIHNENSFSDTSTPPPARQSTKSPTEHTHRSSTSPKLSPHNTKLSEKDLLYHKKYTNLGCSCGREFETLYELTMHVKDSGHRPCSHVATHHEFPKLVRGQDMWLNHGSEQTRQILRCIRCGESFKSLPDLTVHMMKTRHYTNIVGSESPATGITARKVSSRLGFPGLDISAPGIGGSGGLSDTYRCFDCNEVFVGIEHYSKHLVSSGHQKSSPVPIIIQPMSPDRASPASTESSSANEMNGFHSASKRHRSSSESSDKESRRPTVSKLLDYRDYRLKYEQALRKNGALMDMDESSLDSFTNEDNKIRCETCSEKIEMSKFVEHVRKCVKSTEHSTPFKKRRLEFDEMDHARSAAESARIDYNQSSSNNGRHSPLSPLAKYSKDAFIKPEEEESRENNGVSALKAMEKFIEQSFTRPNHSTRRHNRYLTEENGHLESSSVSRKNAPFLSGIMSSLGSAYMNGTTQALPRTPRAPSPRTHSPDPQLYSKYLPPLFVNPEDSSNPSKNISESSSRDKIKEEINDNNADAAKSPGSIKREKEADSANTLSLSDKPNAEPSESRVKPNNFVVDQLVAKIKSEKNDSISSTEISQQSTHNKQQADIDRTSYLSKYLDTSHRPLSDDVIKVGDNMKSGSDLDSSTSALASLQGLVYGNSFAAKPPLNNLHKMVNPSNEEKESVDNKQISGGESPIMRNSSPKPETLIEKSHSPMLRVATPTSPGGMLSMNNNVTSPVSPASFAPKPVPPSPSAVSETCSDPRSPSSVSENESKTIIKKEEVINQNGDYRLPICRAPLTERCKTVKNSHKVSPAKQKPHQENGAKPKKSPYVYLPLDHSAKFNKYYEMANELASKTK